MDFDAWWCFLLKFLRGMGTGRGDDHLYCLILPKWYLAGLLPLWRCLQGQTSLERSEWETMLWLWWNSSIHVRFSQCCLSIGFSSTKYERLMLHTLIKAQHVLCSRFDSGFQSQFFFDYVRFFCCFPLLTGLVDNLSGLHVPKWTIFIYPCVHKPNEDRKNRPNVILLYIQWTTKLFFTQKSCSSTW